MPYSRFLFLNLGHTVDHLFMLMFPAVAALAAADLGASYGELLPLATGSFIAFNANGVIRTFFKPNDGERYYRRQSERGKE